MRRTWLTWVGVVATTCRRLMGSRGGVFVFAPDRSSLLEAGEAVTFQLRSLRGALGDPARQLRPDRGRFLEAGPAPPRREVEALRSRGAEDRASCPVSRSGPSGREHW